MNTAIPERIAQVREFAGLSKTELAQKLEVSVAAVSQWEDGSKNPTTRNLVSLAQVLGVDVRLLMKPVPSVILTRRGTIIFRAQSAAKTARMKRRAHRFAEMASELFIMLEKWVSFPKIELPRVIPSNVEKAATDCRKAWGLGNLPITKLGELFESKGIRLCTAEFGDERCDAYSCIIDGRPFAFLGTEKQDRARARFDIAHELGHLLLHQHLSEDEILKNSSEIEKQANMFASAFLMPAETFSKDVVDTSVEGFKRLKPKWGVSIQAMIYRARTLELISEETFERHFRNMSARGWRKAKAEPLDETVPPVNRSLGKSSLELLESNNVINIWEILSDLPLPKTVFQSVFEKDLKYATANRVVLAKEFIRPTRDPHNRN
jgi:Zn-dependent peptidase ImmA (M78 family)/transcriptional regulator with XRE-family HTH domain